MQDANEAFTSAIKEYAVTIDDLYGHYLDSTLGYLRNTQFMEQLQQDTIRSGILEPGKSVDDLTFLFGFGKPDDPRYQLNHAVSQGEFKRRNMPDGPNYARASQFLIVLLYEYWETRFRNEIAEAFGIDRSEVKIPILGDLRLLRHDILHNKGVVQRETSRKISALSPVAPGTFISFDQKSAYHLIMALKEALDEAVVANGFPDPEHRNCVYRRGSVTA